VLMTIRYFSNFSSIGIVFDIHLDFDMQFAIHMFLYFLLFRSMYLPVRMRPMSWRLRDLNWETEVSHEFCIKQLFVSLLGPAWPWTDKNLTQDQHISEQVHNLTEAQLLLHKQVYEPQTHLLRIAASFLAIWCSFSFPLSVSLLSRNTHHKHKHEHTNTQAHKHTWWSANPSTRMRTISSSTKARIAQMKVLSVKMALARVEMELHPQHQSVHDFK
jgi:hypothetical protein